MGLGLRTRHCTNKSALIGSVVAVALVCFAPAVSEAQTVAGGLKHTLVVKPDGTVWSFGDNFDGELGDNTNTDRTTPVMVSGLTDIVAVAAGQSHSMALSSSGVLWTWGDNYYGELGDGSGVDQLAPVQVPSLSGVSAIAAGQFHSVALLANGDVYVWGRNDSGQFGNGTTGIVNANPTLVATDAIAIGAGVSHTLIVKTDGSVWAAGANAYGQLGIGSTGSYVTTFTAMTGVAGAVKAVGGGRHSLIQLADGTVKAVGFNGYGQLGDGMPNDRLVAAAVSGLTDVTTVTAGYDHSGALKSDGTVCTWGLNSSGQLGDGTTNNSNVPICLAASNIVAFAAGQQYNVAVDSLGAMFTWGRNSWGQLGDGTLVDEHSPLAISGANYAWRVAKPVFSMTSGTYTSVTTVYVTVATPGATIRYTQNGSEPTISDPVVESGGGISVTETQTLTAKAWKSGMPESASTSAVYTMKVATPAFSPAGGNFNSAQSVSITSTTAGATLRYTTDGSTPTASSTVYSGPITVATTTTIKSAGFKTNWSASDIRTATFNLSFGSLAAPTASPGAGTFEGQVTVTLSAAPGTTIRYTTNGADPTTASPVYSQPLVIAVTTTLKAKAFSPDYAPSPTLTQVYTIRTTTPILSLAGGTYAPGTLLVVSNPDATATTRITLTGVDPVASDAAVVSGTTMLAGSFTLKARAFKAGCVDSLIATASYALTDPLGMGAVSSGTSHSLLATPGGLIYGWGLGSSGQIGDGGTSNRSVPTLVQPLTGVVSLSAGAAHSLAATYDGRVFAWGSNGSGRLGDGTTQNQPRPVQVASLTNVVSVAAGGAHSLALTADGFVYAWGSGTNGVLGLGNTSSTSWPTLIPTLSNVIAIAAGNTHSLAVTSNGTVYAWGANNFWQLGDGTTQARNSPAPVAGLVGAVAVTAGTSHSAVRLQNGDLYLWGSGTSGQLGLGAATNRTTPTLLPDFKALSLVAGGSFTAALRNDGVLMAWGANASGQIGDTTTQQRNSPATVVGPSGIALFAPGGTHSIAVTSYGHVWSWGAGGSGQLGDGTTVASRPTPQDVFAITGTWGATSQPILSAGTGVYHDIQSITVSNPMTSAVMHYTTSGNVPAETDPTIASGSAVLVDRTLTLRVRAWAPGYPASEVTTGVFSLTPLSPTISPTGGPFTVSQAVTMSTATPNAVVRYTVDGSNPTGTSTAYSGPVTVSTFTTIKARAFYLAWTPSDLSSGTLSFQYGTLQPPTASSPSGMYPPDHVVSLSAEPDTTIKYTLDGTDPGPSSPTYTAPITFPVALTTLKARAYRVDFAPSVVATWTYQVTSDFTPPEITAHISPAPNANGWYHTD